MPGEMVVKQYGPDVQIKISGSSTSDWQSLKEDFVAVSTFRQVNAPANTWAITLVSRREGGKTWAKRIRPMDYVEIRFGRYKKRGEKPQMIMRGLVDQVSETIGISADGQPQRQITISGRDLGKLLIIKQLYIFPGPGLQGLVASFLSKQGLEQALFPGLYEKMTEQVSVDATISCQEFMDNLKKFIYNATSDSSNTNAGQGVGPTNLNKNIPELKFTAKDMDEFRVSPLVLKTFQGSVWNLLEAFHNKPICEFLLNDYEDGPELLWRWAPYKDKDGSIIPPASEPHSQNNQGPGTVDVSTEDITDFSLTTTDANVYNFFYVDPSQLTLVAINTTGLARTDGGSGGSSGSGGGDSNPTVRKELMDKYGFKEYYIQSPLMPWRAHPTEKDRTDLADDWRKLGAKMAGWMDKAFSNNANLEGGTLTMKGDERIEIGTYMKIKETGQEFYIDAVRHDFMLNPPRFTSTLQVSRGLWTKDNPYPDDTGTATGDPGGNSTGDNQDSILSDPESNDGSSIGIQPGLPIR
jgi:hypothetical protein